MNENLKPKLKLVGLNGNSFLILGRAIMAGKEAGWSKEKLEKFKKAAHAGDYNALLCACGDYFEVY